MWPYMLTRRVQPGPLIGVALEVLNRPPNDLRALGPRNQPNAGTLDDRDRLRLQRFLTNVRCASLLGRARKLLTRPGCDRVLTLDRTGKPTGTPRPVKKLSAVGASGLNFNLRDGGTQTVADFFRTARNQPLKYPHLICVEV
jgi:eukaryotic translation initiation factor 2C